MKKKHIHFENHVLLLDIIKFPLQEQYHCKSGFDWLF